MVTFKVFNAVAQKVEVGLKLLQSVFSGFIALKGWSGLDHRLSCLLITFILRLKRLMLLLLRELLDEAEIILKLLVHVFFLLFDG